ncbi:hypothetical protein C8R42DRAFT_241718 [Lentinula raphanica]|nr:hypothetical protein C8R42DRAFT_241718 [Lentinula raphanica]
MTVLNCPHRSRDWTGWVRMLWRACGSLPTTTTMLSTTATPIALSCAPQSCSLSATCSYLLIRIIHSQILTERARLRSRSMMR